jgi:hypothetical protein
LKNAVQVDQPLGSPLTLGMNSQPSVNRLDGSAPAIKGVLQLDPAPNLSITTLASAAVAPFHVPDTSQYQAKYPIFADTPQRPLTLGLNPQPGVIRWDWSAPRSKYAVQVDEPLGSPLTLGINPQPTPGRLDAPAPGPKYQVEVDLYPNTLALGVNPQPAVIRWFESSPAPKYAVRVDVYPNLLTSTLAAPLPSLAAMPTIKFMVAGYPQRITIMTPDYSRTIVLADYDERIALTDYPVRTLLN